jgi:twitching motility two-component system response regulator PilH
MSEAMTIPPLGETAQKRTPTVYFIDDSATMREVIKIAFRREDINVITCADAASALAQFEQNRPDVVITDVIMPDQDGYSVCSHIKQHPDFSNTPVVLMSGVVNKSVADKAVAVKADELIRKPFQPQELIGRVKSLLEPKGAAPSPAAPRTAASNALSNLFAPPPAPAAPRNVAPPPPPPAQQPSESVWPRALAEAFTPRQPMQQNQDHQTSGPAPARPSPTASDVHKLRVEIAHLDLLVKKLQTELQIERQYNQALETQIRTLTEVE